MTELDTYRRITRDKYRDAAYARHYAFGQTGAWSRRNAKERLLAQREVAAIASLLALVEPGVTGALDIPAGTGKLQPLLCRRFGRVIAGDVSREMLACVPTTAFRRVQADATALPFADRSFGCVVSLRLLHRVPASIRAAMLREFARLSSRYLLVSYGRQDAVQQLRLGVRRRLSRESPVPYPARRQEVVGLARQLGFTVVAERSPVPLLSAESIVLFRRAT